MQHIAHERSGALHKDNDNDDDDGDHYPKKEGCGGWNMQMKKIRRNTT